MVSFSPMRPCRQVGCRTLVERGYCEQHQPKVARRYDQLRGTSAQRGYGSRWQKARATYLRSHPFCVACAARHRLVPANVVDHVVPHRGDQTLFWDTNNWQPLCKSCHDAKTAREDGGLGNRRLA
ncbi:HNH endonuclease [Jeongeupia naejangsanensis]|uniref:Putative HNH nuclease YajD n=1 Tax=Jeongeupia naejangsanensis TaxID=613195 RepID=A0ABS2BHY4_9NEIS|nr:HNH endonuclease [Jeongeupia naejangsanensis]MBM3114561.1 HNH endonuclease [Jeongeupia naejangsanensis]